MPPLVSVIISTRNRLPLLRQALASVLAQTLPSEHIEILVFDDGSSDGTSLAVASEFPQVNLLSGCVSRGASLRKNELIQQSQGQFVAVLDDDDLWEPTFLARQIQALQNNPEAALSFCGYSYLNRGWSRPHLRPGMNYSHLLDFLICECFIHAMSLVVCRRQAALEAGPFDSQLSIIQDLDWYVRLLEQGPFVYLPEKLARVRIHSSNLTQSQERWIREELSWLSARGGSRRQRAYRYLFHCKRAGQRGDPWLAARCLFESLCLHPQTSVAVSWRKWRQKPNLEKELSELKQVGLKIEGQSKTSVW